MAKKQAKKQMKKTNIIVFAVALILILVGVLIAFSNKDEKEKEKTGNSEEQIVATEETVENEYGFTKQDAIDVIKKIYKSDSYEFKAEIREDNMYIVTVSNPDTDSEYKYVVNPNDGSFTELK